jgi:hypothetical protein
MAISACNKTHRNRKKNKRSKLYGAKGVAASRLRQRKHQLARRFEIPLHLLGGSLNQVARKCGKPTCRCASGEGHLMWTLTYSVDGQRRVEFVPDDLVPLVAPLFEEGRAYRDAVHEILTINAQLVTLWRKQQRSPKKTRRTKK